MKSWLARLPKPDLESDPVWHNPSGKSGPNGPALITSHYDAPAVVKSGLVPAIKVLGELSSHSDLDYLEQISEITPDRNYRCSKLSFLSEGGGKTRVIAIGDY